MPNKTSNKTSNKKPGYPFIIDSITFSQDGNCCTGTDEREKLLVEFHDGGGGYFYVIKTDMFAFDHDSEEYKKLIEKIQEICESNNIHSEKEFHEYCKQEDVNDFNKSIKHEIQIKKPNNNNVTCLSFNNK